MGKQKGEGALVCKVHAPIIEQAGEKSREKAVIHPYKTKMEHPIITNTQS